MKRFSVESCMRVGGQYWSLTAAQTLLVLAYLGTWAFLSAVNESPHVGQLEKGEPVDQGHCQQGVRSEKSHNKTLSIQILAHVDVLQCGWYILLMKNFMTPMKVTKISTPCLLYGIWCTMCIWSHRSFSDDTQKHSCDSWKGQMTRVEYKTWLTS